MEIIDAQIHELQPFKPWNPKYDPESALVLACEVAIAAMDAVGVDVALFNARQALCEFATAHYPDRFGSYVVVDPNVPNLETLVSQVRAKPGSLALRAVLGNWKTGGPPEGLRAGVFDPLFAAAERHGVPLFCFIPDYAGDLEPVAKAHPQLTLIVDHIGVVQQPMPMHGDSEPFARLPELLKLAEFPNIAVKWCGAETLSREPYPHSDLWPHLHKVIDRFGPNRVMWASDFTRLRYKDGVTERAPRDRWYGLYSDSLSYLRDTSELSSADKEMILGGTVRRVLRWPK